MTKKIIETARSELRITLDTLIEEAREVVGEYWLEWRLMNKKLAEEERKQVVPKYLRGNIAPRITVRTGKTYIEWGVYAPNRYGGRKKNWGDRIAPRKGPIYRMSQFSKKAQDWEFELIEQTEKKLRPLRYAMEHIHNSQAYLSRLISKM